MTASFRFGVSRFTTWPWSFEQDIENYSRLGVEAIEICESKLDDERAEKQLALVGERGLSIDSVQPAIRTLFPSQLMPEPEDPRERTELFCRTIERISRFAPDNVSFICNTGQAPNGDIQEVFQVAARECRAMDKSRRNLVMECRADEKRMPTTFENRSHERKAS
jgi:hypothetical protein